MMVWDLEGFEEARDAVHGENERRQLLDILDAKVLARDTFSQ
jgi:hypothetical protein